jgi:alkyl hydroperoxide reductase subunit AhpC
VQGDLKAMQVIHNDVGRSVDEAMRLLDAFQFVEENGVVCACLPLIGIIPRVE